MEYLSIQGFSLHFVNSFPSPTSTELRKATSELLPLQLLANISAFRVSRFTVPLCQSSFFPLWLKARLVLLPTLNIEPTLLFTVLFTAAPNRPSTRHGVTPRAQKKAETVKLPETETVTSARLRHKLSKLQVNQIELVTQAGSTWSPVSNSHPCLTFSSYIDHYPSLDANVILVYLSLPYIPAFHDGASQYTGKKTAK